jgi:hypothetical protein
LGALRISTDMQPPLDESFVELSDEEVAVLKADVLAHLGGLKLPSWQGSANGPLSKDDVRAMHASQRRDVVYNEIAALKHKAGRLLEHFADGSEVDPERVDPELVLVKSDDPTSDLFRMAALRWSVPVSKGYGRRLRFLVRDRSNGKLIGIFGLTDPVFNLRSRDDRIGWTVEQRRSNLVHAMDAFVVGAVPPYSSLLGGKLVTSLIGSAEVNEIFASKYAETQGIISERRKSARLTLVTVTSALGRSSMYNRLKLYSAGTQHSHGRTLVELERVGWTEGYGHFHLSDSIFRRLRLLVASRGHAYARAYKYGEGPNWRMRLSRVGLSMLGLDPDLLRHGISREVYVMLLATNTVDFLCDRSDEALLDRPSVAEIADAAKLRWILPRAARCPDFRFFQRVQLLEELDFNLSK